MSKFFAAALMAMAMFVPAQAETLTVYDGSDGNQYVPIYGGYFDTQNVVTQIIYHESDLQDMTGALITSMKFYIGYPEDGNKLNGGKLSVWIGTTDLNQFSGYSPEVIDGLTPVAEISMTAGETEVVVDFNQPFVYTGGNLVVKTIVEESSNYYDDLYFWGLTTEFNASMYYMPASGSSWGQNFGPKTTFDYTVADDFAVISTNAIDFGTLYPEMQADPQTFNVKNFGKNPFTPVFGALNAPFSIEPAAVEIAPGETATYTVKFNPAEMGEYAQNLTVDCGAAGQFEIALTGAFAALPDNIIVCDGDATNGYLPFYGYYYDAVTKGQMIYTADMLAAIKGKKITTVTYYPTAPMTFKGGKLQLSFKAVEQDGFTTYTALTDLTAVATVTPVEGATELTFTLDEPYEYTGGNLAIEVTNIEKGSNYPRTNFYGQTVDGYYPSFYIYGGSNDKSNFLPKVGFEYVKEEAPEYEIGDVNHDHAVSISDVTTLIDMLLSGVAEFPAEANVNGDETVSISDVTALIDKLLSGN